MTNISKSDYTCYKRYCKTLILEDDPQLISEYRKVHAPGATADEKWQLMERIYKLKRN